MKHEILAFPRPLSMDKDIDKVYSAQRGMKLRDYFAAKALQGMLASGDYQKHNAIDLAVGAYKVSDAMMDVRRDPGRPED